MSNDLPPVGVTTQQEVAEMDKFRRIMEGFNDNTAGMTPSVAPRTSNQGIPTSPTATAAAQPDPAMGNFTNIINDLYGGAAQHAVEVLTESTDPVVVEALDTHKTNAGVKIGVWEIVSRTEKINLKEEKVFDVRRSTSKEIIADSISVYEAAHALVRYLNNGYTINSKEVSNVLELEESFFSCREDAKMFKIRAIQARKRGDENKAAIMEDRFDYAKANAISTKRKLVEANKRSLRS